MSAANATLGGGRYGQSGTVAAALSTDLTREDERTTDAASSTHCRMTGTDRREILWRIADAWSVVGAAGRAMMTGKAAGGGNSYLPPMSPRTFSGKFLQCRTFSYIKRLLQSDMTARCVRLNCLSNRYGRETLRVEQRPLLGNVLISHDGQLRTFLVASGRPPTMSQPLARYWLCKGTGRTLCDMAARIRRLTAHGSTGVNAMACVAVAVENPQGRNGMPTGTFNDR